MSFISPPPKKKEEEEYYEGKIPSCIVKNAFMCEVEEYIVCALLQREDEYFVADKIPGEEEQNILDDYQDGVLDNLPPEVINRHRLLRLLNTAKEAGIEKREHIVAILQDV